jgi:hypothetical protein
MQRAPSKVRNSLRWFQVTAACLWVALASPAVPQPSVPIEVRFTLLDADGKPVAGVPVRLVLATGSGWQRADAGSQVTTNESGEIRWSTRGLPEARRRKMPTNFFTQSTSAPQETMHLAIGAQLSYLGRPWLVVSEGDHFANGTTAQLDGVRVYGLSADGMFSAQASVRNGVWQLPGVPSPLTTPGHQVARFAMTHAGGGWVVELTIKRLPEPVIR